MTLDAVVFEFPHHIQASYHVPSLQMHNQMHGCMTAPGGDSLVGFKEAGVGPGKKSIFVPPVHSCRVLLGEGAVSAGITFKTFPDCLK